MKLAKRISEDARIQVRMTREETMKKLKSAEDEGILNKDGVFKAKEKAQKLVDNANAEIEKNLEELHPPLSTLYDKGQCE